MAIHLKPYKIILGKQYKTPAINGGVEFSAVMFGKNGEELDCHLVSVMPNAEGKIDDTCQVLLPEPVFRKNPMGGTLDYYYPPKECVIDFYNGLSGNIIHFGKLMPVNEKESYHDFKIYDIAHSCFIDKHGEYLVNSNWREYEPSIDCSVPKIIKEKSKDKETKEKTLKSKKIIAVQQENLFSL